MNPQEIRASTVAILAAIAPEIDPADLADSRPLRQQVDLDSMDWLNFLVALHRQLGVDIPESDYRRLVTLDDIVAYVGAKLRG